MAKTECEAKEGECVEHCSHLNTELKTVNEGYKGRYLREIVLCNDCGYYEVVNELDYWTEFPCLWSDIMRTYIGIADCHGIESFMPLEGNENNLGFLVMRASLNRQRHALVYQVELDENQADILNAVLADGDYLKACAMLHDPIFVENVGVEQAMLDSWEMIPNPRLDPYGGRFYEKDSDEEEW